MDDLMLSLTVNGNEQRIESSGDQPLLCYLRDALGLVGTKFGCGVGLCGACTVHVDGNAVRSCVTPISAVAGHAVATIEGLSPDGSHPLQQNSLLVELIPERNYRIEGDFALLVF